MRLGLSNQGAFVEVCAECRGCFEECSVLTLRVKNDSLDNKNQTKWDSYSNMRFECLFK
jgi:hypothetical protein